jgi:uncharacterized protein
VTGDSAPRILRAADRVAVPWKNGAGLTREVAVHPPGSDISCFDWRVSIAELRTGASFSLFPGVDRRMAVLEGSLMLAIDAAEPLGVSPDSAPVCFAGDVAVSAQPLGPLVTDLNVMTRRGRFESRMERRAVPGSAELALRADTTVIVALAELGMRCRGALASLSRLDAALIGGVARCQVLSPAPETPFYLIELSAAA